MSVLAIDQGTSGTKAIVVEPDGRVIASSECEVRPDYRGAGAVEQDPRELLESVLTAGRRAVEECGARIDVVALANQGETVLAWDPVTGKPLTPAIVWQDRRAESVCRRLVDLKDEIAARTGLVLSPYFSAPKMAWLRENLTRDGVVTTSDSWLVHQLTGEFVTDVTTASRSLVLDLDSVEWDEDLLSAFGLDDERLPRLVACDDVVASTSAFGADAPVSGLVVDQQAALLAEGCIEVGSSKCTYGTGAFMLANTGTVATRSGAGLITSVAWRTREGTQYCLDGQAYTVASALRWLVDVGLLADARDLGEAADASSGGVVFVPALAGLAAPYWRADALASFTGLSLATTRASLVRAVVEGIAAQVAVLTAVFADDLRQPVSRLRVDGELAQSPILMQAQADLLQASVEVYPSPHATALGSAALGSLGVTPRFGLADVTWPWTPTAVYEPRWSADRAADLLHRWRVAAECETSTEVAT